MHIATEILRRGRAVEAIKDLAKALGAASKQKRHLSVFQWQVAFDQYALAAAATEQWKFVSSMAHKSVCLQVAHQADSKNRRHHLAVLYDELSRAEFSKRAYAGDPTFNSDVVCQRVDDQILSRAEAMYDQLITGNKGNKGSVRATATVGSVRAVMAMVTMITKGLGGKPRL